MAAKTGTVSKEQIDTISALQGDAWAAWNASYYAEDRQVYRSVSLELYQQDLRERVTALFKRSDEQNALIEANL